MKMRILILVICMVIVGLAVLRKYQKNCDNISLMLNQLLEGKEISYSDIKGTRILNILNKN